jgi:hypothetical protein
LGNFLVIKPPNHDKSREYVESEGYITLKQRSVACIADVVYYPKKKGIDKFMFGMSEATDR